jgi:IS1 family transposase
MTQYIIKNNVEVEATSEEIKWMEEKEAAIPAILANTMRSKRNQLLTETDWMANSDVTMADNWKTYRQALRDLPTHSNWPNLEDSDWPTKP